LIYVILAIALIIFVFIISILLIPFHISLHLFKRGSLTQGSLWISWLGIPLIRRKILSGERKKAKEKEKKRFDWRNLPEMVSLFRESFPYIINILRATMKSSSIERFSCDVVMGLDSPVDTAIVSGYLWALKSIVSVLPNVCLSVKPDFQEQRLDGSMILKLRIIILRIVTAFVRAFFKKPVRQLFRKIKT